MLSVSSYTPIIVYSSNTSFILQKKNYLENSIDGVFSLYSSSLYIQSPAQGVYCRKNILKSKSSIITTRLPYCHVNPNQIIFSLGSIFVCIRSKKYKRIKVVSLTKIFFSIFLRTIPLISSEFVRKDEVKFYVD